MNKRPGSAPEGRDIVAEACAWFADFREGDVPAATRARFDEWLRRSPEHIQAYLEVSAAWSELPTGDPEGRIDVAALVARARESADDNVVALSARAEGAGPPGVARLQITPRRWSLPAVAASIALALVLLGFTAWFVAFRADSYSTGIGEQRTVRLADGSTVELNALSRISVRLSKTLRDIELTRGQALFHVAKDGARPFIVQSEGVTVRAVGTQFDVYRKRNGTTVTVLEGEVAVVPSEIPARKPKRTPARRS